MCSVLVTTQCLKLAFCETGKISAPIAEEIAHGQTVNRNEADRR